MQQETRVSFLSLLEQMTTGLVTSNSKDLLSFVSGGHTSRIGLTGLKSGRQQGWLLLEAPGRTHFLAFGSP